MKKILLALLILIGSNLKAQHSLLPGNIIISGDSIVLYPFSKSIHGIKVIKIDNIISGDSLTMIYYLKKLNVRQDSGKIYLKNNEIVKLHFYRNAFKTWEHGVPKGVDSVNFNYYLNKDLTK